MSEQKSSHSQFSQSLKIANRDNETLEFSSSVLSLIDEKTKKSFLVTISKNDLAKIKDFKLNYLVKHSNIHGFRPGKAPKAFIWNNHKDALANEINQDVVNSSLTNLVETLKLNFFGSPKIDVKSNDIENEISFEASFLVSGEIKMPDFGKLQIHKPVYEITEQDLKKRMDELFNRNKKYEKADTNYSSSKGDRLVIDFEGKINGEAFQGGSAKAHTLELGSGSFIGNFEDQLTGKKNGDEVLVKVKFPENYHSKEYAGKDAEFAVKINEILVAKMLETEAELAEHLGFPGVEELKAKVKEAVENDCIIKRDLQMKKELLDQLDAAVEFAVPEEMILGEFNMLKKQNGNETDEELQKIAKRRVKLGVLLSEIAKDKAIQVTQEDITDAVRNEAMANPMYAKAIIDYYMKNREAIDRLQGPIIENKTVKYLYNEVKNVEKPMLVSELFELKEE